MRWKLRDAYFDGQPSPCVIAATITGSAEKITVNLDKDGYFELAETPKTFALGIFAKAVG